MIITSIISFEKVRSSKNKILSRLWFYSKKSYCFWMSRKQFAKLLDCKEEINKTKVFGYIICVFDNQRFVWAGVEFEDYSDLDFLQKAFKAKWQDDFEIEEIIKVHIPKKLKPVKNNINLKLKRNV